MPHGYNNFIVILLYSLKGNFLKFFSYNVKMAKNIKISEEAYNTISEHAGKSRQSLTKAVDDLVGVTEVVAPQNLRHLVHGIIRNAQGEYENLQPVPRKLIIDRVKQWYNLNPSVAPGWSSLSSVGKSKFYNDIDNVLKRLLKDGDIQKVDTGKYIVENPSENH